MLAIRYGDEFCPTIYICRSMLYLQIHDRRRTAETLALTQGAHPKVVFDMLCGLTQVVGQSKGWAFRGMEMGFGLV
jgi:hypothetical protein